MANISTIRFIERDQIEITKYNQLVENSLGVSIYCYSWYLDSVSDNWGCLVKGDYEAVYPLVYTVKFGQKIIYQPFFTREFSFFSLQELGELDKVEFIESVPPEFKKIDFAIDSKLKVQNLEVTEVMNQELVIGSDYENTYKDYSTNTKRLIKKALKAGCVVEASNNVAKFITFFKENTGSQVNYESKHYENLELLIKTLVENKKGCIYQVKQNSNTLAIGVYLFQNHRITYLKGTADPEGKKIGAMFLLMDKVIKENKTKASVFDFGGSKVSSIANFYKKFGAKDRTYYQYFRNEHSWVLKKGKMLRDLLKK
jgi:hypothetical protein